MRTLWKYMRIHWESQRLVLAKAKKHIRNPKRLVTVLSHCQWVLFTADPSAFLFPLPSATGSLLFLDPRLQMIYFSHFFVPILQAIQKQFSLSGSTLHFKEDILYILNKECYVTSYLVIDVQLSERMKCLLLTRQLKNVFFPTGTVRVGSEYFKM